MQKAEQDLSDELEKSQVNGSHGILSSAAAVAER